MRRTKWGGIADDCFQGSGFFRVAEHLGVSWLVDPDGGRFISKGVNNVRFDQDRIIGTDRAPYADACRSKYGNENVWRAAISDRLASWNFNTVGCWSDELVADAGSQRLAMTPTTALGATFRLHRRDQIFPDVFDAGFAAHIRKSARDRCTRWRDDPGLLGTFIDNELYWSPDWRGADELLTIFLNLPSHRPGRVAAIARMQHHYREFSQFNAIWRTPAQSWEQLGRISHIDAPFFRMPPGGLNDALEAKANRDNPVRAQFSADCDAFSAVVADIYFELCASAIRAVDPNHLVIGSRFGYQPQTHVIAAAGRHLDVVSFNCYDVDASAVIDAYAVAAGKPCLISEFAFRGDDSGLPNTRGAGPRVASQTERARCFERYVTAALSKPSIVGYHWFEHADQPAEGRFDGENSNFGTVTIEDEVYTELTDTMTRINAAAEQIHATAVPADI